MVFLVVKWCLVQTDQNCREYNSQNKYRKISESSQSFLQIERQDENQNTNRGDYSIFPGSGTMLIDNFLVLVDVWYGG
jgi:hypothetical protein